MKSEREIGLENIIRELLEYREYINDTLGECMHTAFRKGTDRPSANAIWKAINESRDGAWPEAIEYMKECFDYPFMRAIKDAEKLLEVV